MFLNTALLYQYVVLYALRINNKDTGTLLADVVMVVL